VYSFTAKNTELWQSSRHHSYSRWCDEHPICMVCVYLSTMRKFN